MATFQEGGRVSFGGREFVVPKATLRTAVSMSEVQKVIASGEVGPLVGLAGLLVLVLKPAQPELTIEELLDLPSSPDELVECLSQAQVLAGFKRVAPGEAASP